MPNRLLREGICTSDTINELSAGAEVLFYRLLVVADDYGYIDARLAILKAGCYPLKKQATESAIEGWLSELATTKLIQRYTHNGKPFAAVNKWEQRVRSRQKYISPTDPACIPIDGQLSDNGQSDVRLGKGLGKGKGKGRGAKLPIPEDFAISKNVDSWAIKNQVHNLEKHFEYFVNSCKARAYLYADWDRALMNAVLKDWAKIGKGVNPSSPKKVAW